MNFEEYVNQMTKKLKLAVVTAVLKNKPSDLTTDQYIALLREKLNENTIDIDDEELISSKDFDFEENTFNSDKHIGFNDNLNERSADVNSIGNTVTQCKETVDQAMVFAMNRTKNVETASVDLLQDYNVVLEDTISGRIEVNDVAPLRNDRSPETNSLNEVLKTLRAIDENNIADQEHNMTNLTQDIFSEYSQIMIPRNNNLCEENMAIDNQPFVNEDTDDFTIIDERLKAKVAKNIKRNKEICSIQEDNQNTIENIQYFDEEIHRNLIDTSVNENQTSARDFVTTKSAIVAKNIDITEKLRENVEDRNIYISQNFGENIPETNMSISDNLTCDTQQTILYTFHGFTEDTQISQSQCNNIEIPNNFIFGPKLGTNNDNLENMKIVKTTENNNIPNKITHKGFSVNENSGLMMNMMIDSNQIEYIIDKSGKTYAVLQSIHLNNNPKAIFNNKDHSQADNKNLSSVIKEFEKKDVSYSKTSNMKAPINNTGDLQIRKEFNSVVLENYGTQKDLSADILDNDGTQIDCNSKILENYRNQKDFYSEISENDRTQTDLNKRILDKDRNQKDFNSENGRTQNDFDTGTLENRTQKDLNTDILENDEDEEMSSEDVAVPFKVVKELSKIKSYLYRERKASTDGFFSDSSGYKSDSQSSVRSAHLSESWMHQSAYCLYNYIVQCPLVAVTQEIVAEISEVVGKLIDKLHEEEKYPSFVEELLDKIDHLLRDLYEGDNSADNVLLEKDEIIQRLLLLNKSTHILKFTINKITGILDKSRTNITSEDTSYELSNICEIENLCYIFSLLEILLKKYIKTKNNYTSQSTQNSQETKILKKTSISEIWRKKWNANLKEIKTVGSQQKVCCLDKCGVVLNKIIVECIGEYSLISFAALQCFNLLQNQ